MEKRYQFLAIAPSQGIGQRIEEMAAEMPDVEMRVCGQSWTRRGDRKGAGETGYCL